MFGGLKKFLTPTPAAERELAYLNAAQDRYDLELRMREVDRGLFRKRANSYPF